jgi:trans-aconitate 2-methyltransferase
VTEHLLRRLPRGRVVALDGSAAMLDQARQRLGDRVDYVHADLGRPLDGLVAPVDAIFSTATFHWVPDHDALFAHLAAVLRPGGALVAQCGGEGNVAGPLAAAEALGVTSDHPHYFATPADTARRLDASGFVDVWTWLQPETASFATRDDLESFLLAVVLRTHVDGMSEDERRAFGRAVADRLPGGVIDYVRLNILARRRP